MITEAPSPKKKFWIGFTGGLTPYALGFATFTASITPEDIRQLQTEFSILIILARIIPVLIYSVLGGLLSLIWNPKERNLRRLFIIGMAAPAILYSTLNNITSNLPNRKISTENKLSTQIISPQTNKLPQIHLQESIPARGIQKINGDIAAGGKETGVLIAISHQPDHLESEEPQKIRNFFEEMLYGLGVTRANTKPSLVFILGGMLAILIIFLAYRACAR